MSSYLPSADSNFDEWVDNFMSYVQPRLEAMGFTAEDFADIAAAVPDWKSALNTHLMWKAQAQGATTTKNENRADLEQKLRTFVGRVQTSPLVTDADRVSMGITVRGLTVVPVAMPQTLRPVGHANGGQSLKHIINFQNDGDAGVSKARPAGMRGCEIWVKVGEPPTGPSDMSYALTATRTPAVVNHRESDAGKTAYYRMRWISTRGETGSWSDVIQATIAA